jgi:RNA polymerase sigma-70 factor, ECF subfamily
LDEDGTEALTAGRSLVEQAWRAHRPYLVNLAYSMLRDIAGAEDATQEAFARLASAEVEQIDDLRGWLIVVTSRICLDQIGSARVRRETVREPATIDTVTPASSSWSVDPADRVTLDDEVRLALLVVLQRLTPPERVALVLHDVFGLPYDTVALAIGRSASTCRQLARRGRLALRAERILTPGIDLAEQRLVTERFISACANGDLDDLLAMLAPDVEGSVDLGPNDRRTGVVVHGAQAVARNLLRYLGSWTTLVEIPTAGSTAVVAFVACRLYAVVTLTIRSEVVIDIHANADPAKLAHLTALVSASRVRQRREGRDFRTADGASRTPMGIEPSAGGEDAPLPKQGAFAP